ncbi:MAG: flagellar motor switch protein FliM, partial [Desulfobacterales bacterium]
ELEQSAGNLIICYPYSMIEPLRHKLSSGIQTESEGIDITWYKVIEEVILSSEVTLKILLGKTEITGERLMYMQEGDVIQLDNDAASPLRCYVDGLEKLTGFIGVQRGFQAFRVDKKIQVDCGSEGYGRRKR